MASIGTTDFVRTHQVEPPPFSLIEYKGLLGRLGDELSQSVVEFKRSPKAFLLALLSPDSRDARRRRRLYAGLAFAVIFHVAFLIVVAIAGWHRFMAPVPLPEERVQVIQVPPHGGVLPDAPAGSEIAKPRGDKDGGGGGGGQQDPRPAMKGPTPQFVPRPPLVAINSAPAPNPALPVPATLVGPESAPPPPVPPGDPTSKGTEPSGGPGSGGGVGPGKGTGAGPGEGLGSGPGKGQGTGYGIDSGDPNGAEGALPAVDFRQPPPRGFAPFRWLYRPTPVTTPEAQDNKVMGDVLLRATFNANGVISDIEVIMPVEYMTESAIESLRRSKFKPATINGKPVTLRNVPIRVSVHY